MRRVVGLLFIAVALSWLPGAAAQERIVGGSSYDDAPEVEPGTYADTIRPGETLYYAVELGEGQGLTVETTFVSKARHAPVRAWSRVFNVQRIEDPFARDGGLIYPQNDLRLTARGDRVGSPDYPEPGLHFFSLSVASGRGPGSQFKVGFEVSVDEIPAPEPPPQPPLERPAVPDEPSHAGAIGFAFLLGAAGGGLVALAGAKLSEPSRRLKQHL